MAEDVAADLRRQLEEVKAKLEEHREVMQLAGLTSAPNTENSEPDG